ASHASAAPGPVLRGPRSPGDGGSPRATFTPAGAVLSGNNRVALPGRLWAGWTRTIDRRIMSPLLAALERGDGFSRWTLPISKNADNPFPDWEFPFPRLRLGIA